MEPEIKLHQIRTPREELTGSDVAILRDIGTQLSMLEQKTPLPWQQFFNSFLISKSVSVEKVAKQLQRRGESEKLEMMFDLLIDASHAEYGANDNLAESASNLVDEISQLAA